MKLYTDKTVILCGGTDQREFDALQSDDFASTECFWKRIPVNTGFITAGVEYASIAFQIFSSSSGDLTHIRHDWTFNLEKLRSGIIMFRPTEVKYSKVEGGFTVAVEEPYRDLINLDCVTSTADASAQCETSLYDFNQILTWPSEAGCDDSCGKRCAVGCADTNPSGDCAVQSSNGEPSQSISFDAPNLC